MDEKLEVIMAELLGLMVTGKLGMVHVNKIWIMQADDRLVIMLNDKSGDTG